LYDEKASKYELTKLFVVELQLYALLSSSDNDEKQALYRAIEHLGIAQIRWLNANAEVLDRPGADVLPTTQKNHIN